MKFLVTEIKDTTVEQLTKIKEVAEEQITSAKK